MSKREKRIADLLRQPTEMRYEELATILSEYGWQERSGKGSHFVWDKPGYRPQTIKVKQGKVGVETVRDIAARIRAEEL
jgi:predicted RNA binding protein YcfA (HicA-like mRNA interferase family)